MHPENSDRFVGGPMRLSHGGGVMGRVCASGRLAARTALAVLLVGGVGMLPTAATGASEGSRHPAGTPYGSHARGDVPRPLAGDTQVTAHDGQFWAGDIPIVF